MTRPEQRAINRAVIERLAAIPRRWVHPPPYAVAVATLNAEGYLTSRGNPWTRRSLYRMLQRFGYSGLHGLVETLRADK